jgi:hypothetical protein
MRRPWRMTGPMGLALVLGLSACGDDGETTRTGQEGGTGAVGASDALDDAPLEQPPGSPVATDETSLWYTDFGQLARRDLESGRWDVRDLPFDREQIFSLVMVPDGAGGLKGLAGLCEADGCDEGVVSDLAAWSVGVEGDAQRVDIEVPVELSDSAGNVITAPVAAGEQAAFRVANGASTLLVRWTDAPRVETVERALPTLCATPDGFVGVEDQVGGGQALAPKVVVAGPDLASLRPVETDPGAAGLLDGAEAAASCLQDGLAVVGPDAAYELREGRWTTVPSDVGEPLQRQLAIGLPVVDASGTLAQAGTVLNLSRDDRGWHALATWARPSAYGLIGGEVMSYPSDFDVPFDPATEGADPAEGEPVPDGEEEGG